MFCSRAVSGGQAAPETDPPADLLRLRLSNPGLFSVDETCPQPLAAGGYLSSRASLTEPRPLLSALFHLSVLFSGVSITALGYASHPKVVGG